MSTVQSWQQLGLAGALFVVALLVPIPAGADDAAQASFHFDRAVKLSKRGRWEDALRDFFVVRRLVDSPQSLFNIAVCFDQLDRADKAFFFYSEYLRRTTTETPRRNAARRALGRLRPRVGVLALDTVPGGATILIDEPDHGSYGSTPALVPVPGGQHRVWLKKAGYAPMTLDVTVAVGQTAHRTVALDEIVGRLSIATEPAGAISVLTPSGATVAEGPSPYEAKLPPGPYMVEAGAPGHRRARLLVEVQANKRVARTLRLESLPPPTGDLTVASNRPGAVIEVDGQATGFAPSVLTDLAAGRREVRVSAPGTVPWSGQVEVRSTDRGFLTVNLEPPPTSRRSVATWLVGGAGVSALLAAGVTGALTLDARSRYEERRQTPDGNDSRAQYDQASALQTATDGLLISGAIALGVAVVLYFVTEEEDDRRTEARFDWQ